MLEENSRNTKQKDSNENREVRDERQAEFSRQLKAIEDKIYEKSLSYEYFWRSLVSILLDSTKCEYWIQEHH